MVTIFEVDLVLKKFVNHYIKRFKNVEVIYIYIYIYFLKKNKYTYIYIYIVHVKEMGLCVFVCI